MPNDSSVQALRDNLSRVTAELAQARRQLRRVDADRHEPIAIVGMSCRMPGGIASPEDLWRVVSRGIDTVGPLPTDRGWDLDGSDLDRPDEAPLLDDVAGFDNAFFDVEPDEALAMDPQHRLLLETSWEAVERARIDPLSLAGQRVGVFAGLGNNFYHGRLSESEPSVRGQCINGASLGAAASRISFHLKLRGPALSLDSACASSLVTTHLAATALRKRDCDFALAGGAVVIPSAYLFDDYYHAQERPSDGRIKPFSGAADGSNLSEGVGVLLVERLSDARRHGHRVLAKVMGSAIDQDGVRDTFGSLSPQGLERLVHAALADAKLDAGDVDVVEAHVPGNLAGDAMEAEAYQNVYGAEHSKQRPLWIGSAKSNWGNAGAAAGVAGIIKLVMAMRHGVLPKSLNMSEPSPYVDWSSGGMALLKYSRRWPDRNAPRRAAISGFAAIGSSSHIILEQPDVADTVGTRPVEDGTASPLVVPWLVSGRSEEALREQAVRLAEHADRASLWDIALSLATTRSCFEERAVVLGTDAAEMAANLRALAVGDPTARVVRGGATGGKTAFLCQGTAEAVARGGTRLRDSDARFAAVFASVLGELGRGDTSDAPLTAFVTQVALHRLLESWGVTFDHVGGHSVGQEAAAHLTGTVSLREAAALAMSRDLLGPAAPSDDAAFSMVISTDPAARCDDARGFTAVFDAGLSPREAVLAALARAHVRGVAVNWRGFFADRGARLVDLPTYPFQHKRFWLARDTAAPLGL